MDKYFTVDVLSDGKIALFVCSANTCWPHLNEQHLFVSYLPRICTKAQFFHEFFIPGSKSEELRIRYTSMKTSATYFYHIFKNYFGYTSLSPSSVFQYLFKIKWQMAELKFCRIRKFNAFLVFQRNEISWADSFYVNRIELKRELIFPIDSEIIFAPRSN